MRSIMRLSPLDHACFLDDLFRRVGEFSTRRHLSENKTTGGQ